MTTKEICRFASICKGYRKEHYTCAHEEEACWYCGYYRRHKEALTRLRLR